MGIEDSYYYGDPLNQNLEYRDRCPNIQFYVEELNKIVPEQAKGYFYGQIDTKTGGSEQNLPFVYRALEKVYPEVVGEIREEWSSVEKVVREMEAGGH